MSDPARRNATTFATWVYVLFADGVAPQDEAVASGCHAVRDAADEATGDAAGEALVDTVAARIDAAGGLAQAASALYGDRVSTELGAGDREARTQRIRRYQFDQGLPWLARIWERRSGGSVSAGWVLVERVTDAVHAMDPNPWDDVDEERHLPVPDFHVLWELDDCTSVHLT